MESSKKKQNQEDELQIFDDNYGNLKFIIPLIACLDENMKAP